MSLHFRLTNKAIVEAHILKILGLDNTHIINLNHLIENIEDLENKTNLSNITANIVENELKRFNYNIFEYLLMGDTCLKLEMILLILTGKCDVTEYVKYYYNTKKSIASQAVYIASKIQSDQS